MRAPSRPRLGPARDLPARFAIQIGENERHNSAVTLSLGRFWLYIIPGNMGNYSVGTPSSGVTASARKTSFRFRYIPATLACLLLLALLLATGAARVAEPWFFGFFLESKGEPPVSRTTVLVSADAGGGAL